MSTHASTTTAAGLGDARSVFLNWAKSDRKAAISNESDRQKAGQIKTHFDELRSRQEEQMKEKLKKAKLTEEKAFTKVQIDALANYDTQSFFDAISANWATPSERTGILREIADRSVTTESTKGKLGSTEYPGATGCGKLAWSHYYNGEPPLDFGSCNDPIELEKSAQKRLQHLFNQRNRLRISNCEPPIRPPATTRLPTEGVDSSVLTDGTITLHVLDQKGDPHTSHFRLEDYDAEYAGNTFYITRRAECPSFGYQSPSAALFMWSPPADTMREPSYFVEVCPFGEIPEMMSGETTTGI